MKEIKLVNIEKVALVDDEDFDFLNRLKWFSIERRKLKHYPSVKLEGMWIAMHSLLIDKTQGMDDDVIDHIDRNTYNNQKSNLRLLEHHWNLMNSGPHRDNVTGYKGVSKEPKTGMYYARIIVHGHKYHLGTFYSAELAAKAYNRAAIKYFGNVAYLNKIPD